MRRLCEVLVLCLCQPAALAPTRAGAQQERTTIAAERVSVLAVPANDGRVVMTLKRGAEVAVLERRQAWTRVSVRARSGWVRNNSLAPYASRKSSPPVLPATPRRADPLRAQDAQRRAAPPVALQRGDNVLGPVVGMGGINGSLALGGELEHALARLPALGNGTLGLSAQAFYYHYAPIPGVGISSIPFGAAANYHFALGDRRLDPFLGLGVGYTRTSISGGGFTISGGSGVFFWGRAGLRYFVRPGVALHADAGLGSATVNVGVMVKP